MKLLIADDDRAFVHLMATKLKAQGFDIVIAYDAMQAIMLGGQSQPDAILLDFNLPGGGCLQTLGRLRLSSRTSHIPILVVSAASSAEIPPGLTQHGADEFLSKPIDFEKLYQALESIVKKPIPGRATPASATPDVPKATSPASGVVPAAHRARRRVLLADDDPVHNRLVHTWLAGWGYQVRSVQDGAEALRVLRGDGAPPLALLDWMMPGMNGPDVCRALRAVSAQHYTYVVLLSAKNTKTDMISGLEAGADDYLTKPVDAQELRVRLKTGERILELEELLRSAHEAVREQAARDPLTGLWNRATISDVLAQELNRSERSGSTCSVFMLDVDHFKRINDQHGHLAGDAVLRAVAGKIKKCVRNYDYLGRYGGEEFVLVAPDCIAPSALRLANRIREGVSCERIEFGGGSVEVTMSIGVKISQAGETPEEILHAADQALYRAKSNGRNRVELAPATTQPTTVGTGQSVG